MKMVRTKETARKSTGAMFMASSGRNGFEPLMPASASETEIETIAQDQQQCPVTSELHNRESLLVVVNQNGLAIRNASDELRNDPEVVLSAIRNDTKANQYVVGSKLFSNVDFMREVVKYTEEALQYASEILQNDYEIVQRSVQYNGKSLLYASNELKKDRDIVLKAIEQNGDAFEEIMI